MSVQKRITRKGARILLTAFALLGSTPCATACFAPSFPPSDEQLERAEGDVVAFKGVLSRVLAPADISEIRGLPYPPVKIELRPVLVFRGAPDPTIVITYHSCNILPTVIGRMVDIGDTINVIARRMGNGEWASIP